MPQAIRIFWCFVVSGALLNGVGHAQRGSALPEEPVAIDFYAIGPDGPVFDLRPDEVTIKIDGRARAVRSLRYIPLPMGDPVVPRTAPDLEPPFATNQVEANGRWVTIIVDHESIRPGTERDAVNAVIRMIRHLGPRDRVSYLTMPNGGLEVEFTENHDQVIEALRRFRATGQREPTEQERSCRTRNLLNSMSDYIKGLASFEGPKQIVLVSTGMLNPRRDAPMLGPPGPCEIRMIYYQEVSRAASLARASMFVVQPDDVSMDPARQVFVDPTASRFAAADEDRAGLESLAGVMAGEFMRIIGPEDDTLLKHVRASAGYYIATVDATAGERNGAPHRAEVAVSRAAVRIRTRPEVFIPRPATQTKAGSTREMLRDGVFYRALPIRLTAFASASGPSRIKILTVVDSPEPGTRFTQAMFGIIDARDKLVAQWTANDRELGSMPVVTAGEGNPGTYRVRVAAIDESGRRGTAEYPLVAQLTEAGPLTLSGLALGVSQDGAFATRMVFGGDQAAVSYLEVYGRPPSADSVTVRVEVASGPDERAIVTAAARVMPQAGEDRRIVVGAVPIAALAPGDYLVRAIVSVDGRPVGRVHRTLRKSASGS